MKNVYPVLIIQYENVWNLCNRNDIFLDTYPVCLGCYDPVDCTTLCSRCSWPVCGIECENLSCHKDNECEVFSKVKVKFQPVENPEEICLQYECITPLR